jgi:hypothetical protein
MYQPIYAASCRHPPFRQHCIAFGIVLAVACPHFALAQQAQQPAAPATPPPVAAPGPTQTQQQFQQSPEWSKLPRMQLERQFAGPLQDTVIQRWRDPVDGTICYLYLPISVAHTPTTSTGFVQYGGNIIGSINCLPMPIVLPAPTPTGRK